MSSGTLRCAVVGLVQGLEDVYTTLHHPRYTLVAVCDNRERPWQWLTGEVDITREGPDAAVFPHHAQWVEASRAAPGFRDVEYIPDFSEVLRRPDIDAVILVLPDALHESYAVAALEAGKFVLSTKPMARTLGEASAIADVARAHPGHYMLGFQISYSRFATTVRDILASGEIGTPRQIRFDYHRGPWRPVHRKKYADVDGSMIKEGVHWLDMIYRLSGELPWRSIAGFGGLDMYAGDFEFEDNGTLMIDFEGFRAAHTFSYFRQSRMRPEDFLLVGEGGSIHGTFEAITVESGEGVRDIAIHGETLPLQHHPGYYEMHDAFSAMCLDGVTPYTTWRTGLENMLTCYAAQIAVAEGRIVDREELADVDWRRQYEGATASVGG